ncbi:hypothetical protein, partial [Intestinimonas sp. UBA1698]|uniref:hypothetical protein n=1 Tax=Intestinimonas sp. UBA1698 TaxID=1946651 RepID=UPI00257ED7A4
TGPLFYLIAIFIHTLRFKKSLFGWKSCAVRRSFSSQTGIFHVYGRPTLPEFFACTATGLF